MVLFTNIAISIMQTNVTKYIKLPEQSIKRKIDLNKTNQLK